MSRPLLGLHHVTATVDRAQPDLDFCERALGLRLVKRTVNFDNHNVYHFYYGTETGAPGTIWTTFPYHGWGVPVGVHGAGQIGVTGFSVPAEAIDTWRDRLRDAGLAPDEGAPRFGERPLVVHDPSGLVLELVPTSDDPRPPWPGGPIDPAIAVRGLHSVTLLLREPTGTLGLMTGRLGFDIVDEMPGRTRLACGEPAAGHLVDLLEVPDAPAAKNGLGTVHHVAFAIGSAEAQLALRAQLLEDGLQVTEVRDRTYFQSIYFREPGGVLFEVATTAPGFTFDEPANRLGQALKLPPWEEPHRAAIEAALPRLDR